MNFIDRTELIQALTQGKKINATELLATVDHRKIAKALAKVNAIPRPFRCTEDPVEEENYAKMSKRDKKLVSDIYERVQKKPLESLPQLLELKKKYPNVPAIHNYICVAYAFGGQQEKYANMLHETHRKFPDYLFGKISLAEYYLNNGRYRKIPSILEQKYEIYNHYPPDVDFFHFSEVRSFYSLTGRYFVRINKVFRAIACYFTMEQVDPDYWGTRLLAEEIVRKEFEIFQRKLFSKRFRGNGKRKKK